MYKVLLVSLICINFFGVILLNILGLIDGMIVPVNIYTISALQELGCITLVLIMSSLFFFKVKRKSSSLNTNYRIKHIWLYEILFVFFVIYYVWNINYSLDNSMRGVGQFELEQRSSIGMIMELLSSFVLPYSLLVFHYKVFGKKTNKRIFLLILVLLLCNITNGGRRLVSYCAIILFLYGYYYKNFSLKNLMKYACLLASLLALGMLVRASGSYAEGLSFPQLVLKSTLQINSDSSFLWGVKDYMARGISMSGFAFFFHFTSIFMPSFLYILLFDDISYPRSVFLFNDLFNTNENQGYDFMMLADFYWNFGYWGYIFYVLVFFYVCHYFKKNIYSIRPYKFITAILMILFMCQQRNDFGAFLKSIVYYWIFIYFLYRFTFVRCAESSCKHID